jgi:hypothetical protein
MTIVKESKSIEQSKPIEESKPVKPPRKPSAKIRELKIERELAKPVPIAKSVEPPTLKPKVKRVISDEHRELLKERLVKARSVRMENLKSSRM